MHPLVRDLYKRVVWIGRDYPTGWTHVQAVWKAALRNPDHCPLWYTAKDAASDAATATTSAVDTTHTSTTGTTNQTTNDMAKEDELVRAVHKGRWAIKEMVGVIQLKKYRSLRRSYDTTRSDTDTDTDTALLQWYRPTSHTGPTEEPPHRPVSTPAARQE